MVIRDQKQNLEEKLDAVINDPVNHPSHYTSSKIEVIEYIYQSFEKRLCTYPIVEMKEIDKIDAIVIGSDTLWDLESPHFRERKRIYSGLAFPNTGPMTEVGVNGKILMIFYWRGK